ncbi:AAA family ATPase [Bacteroidetes/Chlorobi group bacterium ChocPot_Mid]|nr:MAG: AAA family ATPase [Bacteroidetes/Chlorobi group bacterium ChocPot_Mid]
MLEKILSLQENEDIKDKPKIENITAGTPTMTTCWVLLHQSGILKNATLVQSFEKKYAKERGSYTQEVNFEIDDFPQIKAPSAIKRQLTIISREKEDLLKKVKDIEIERQLPNLIGDSERIKEIKEQIIYDINHNTHVLILGERGTGKQVIANSIWSIYHKHIDDYLMTFDCGTFPKELVVAELFGYKKGAFTGAEEDKTGIIELADKRMLFLDEIGNLPFEGQNSLLRLIDDGEIRQVGSSKVKKVGVQIIAATNKNVNDSTLFVQDLKDRFDEIIELQPLRERRADIPALIKYFTNIYSKSSGIIKALQLDDKIIEKLVEYDWPGNVRELEKWIQRLIRRYGGGLICLKDLPNKFITDILKDDKNDINLPDLPLKISIENYVEAIREKARNLSKGNMAEVDRLLNQVSGTEKQRQYRVKKQK